MSTKKLTAAQEQALNQLKDYDQPVTSQQLGVQVKTLQSLQALGLATSQSNGQQGRECETLLWKLSESTVTDEKFKILDSLRQAIQDAEQYGQVRTENGDVITGAAWTPNGLILVKE
ncbi:hypothetical protein MM188_003202 [Vibrio cholerae]|nr:hypothetical protein [Vibrio cholerae]